MKTITLQSTLNRLHDTVSGFLSYNIEMTEVTGGTFWKRYTPGQVAGTEEFPRPSGLEKGDFPDLSGLMQEYPPIDLKNPRIRKMAKALGPAWVRVSGTWATTTYYDFDGHTGGKAPEGYRSVLTREQWCGVLDFVRDTGGKLLVSVANCEGSHNPDGSWNPEQAQLLFDFSRDYGVPISAAEFMNEPNMLEMSGSPKGYTVDDYARDQDAFFRFVRERYPEVLLVGPCSVGDAWTSDKGEKAPSLLDNVSFASAEDILRRCHETPDVFSYHYYNGISERAAFMGGHWDASEAHTDRYIGESERTCRLFLPLRDQYAPGTPMWVTESGDAGAGGNTWASTYLDVLRFANELGIFSRLTPGIIFHNTFCSSDYGLLSPESYQPRPNYWLCWLWNRLMGATVYDAGEPTQGECHLYAHSRRDGQEGVAYMLLNNSLTDAVTVELPQTAQRYTLSADELRSGEIRLGGEVMAEKNGQMPELKPVSCPAGRVTLEPATVTFFIL